VFGFAFKKDTSDTRESSSIFVCKELLEERANIHIYDPKVTEEHVLDDMKRIVNDMYNGDYSAIIPSQTLESKLVEENLRVEQDPYECAKNAHAILILTEWDEFKDYDYEKIYNSMSKPAFIFDGRRLLDGDKMKKIGFKFYSVGTANLENIQQW